MKEGAVVVDPHHGSDWIVPRRVMCAFFWVGIVLLFTGIILLVTSKHKEEFYQSWGAILLGLGFCLLLICFILCLHAYCVITVSDDEVPNARLHPQTQGTLGPPSVRQRAPLKQPPNFKIPSSEAADDPQQSSARARHDYHPARLKPISENGSPSLGTSAYGAAGVRADHVRPSASRTASLPPTGRNSNVPSRDNRSVHYSAFPPSVTISLGSESPGTNDAESGYQNSTGTPKDGNGSVTFSLNGDEESSEKNALSSQSDSPPHGAEDESSSARRPQANQVVPMPIIRDKAQKKPIPQASSANSSQPAPSSGGAPAPDRLPESRHRLSSSSSSHGNLIEIDQEEDESDYHPPRPTGSILTGAMESADGRASERRNSSRYACLSSAVDEETITPELQPPTRPFGVRTPEAQSGACSRPVVSARVTQLPSNRQPKLPNGAPLQLTYSRQYPISSVHAYPSRHRKYNLYTPLRVQVDSPDEDASTSGAIFRPMPPISETHSVDHSQPVEDWRSTEVDDGVHRPPSREIIRPFDRSPSNLLGVQSTALFDRGLSNSANVYLSADQEFSESKMSIYDNLNYIRI